MEVADEVVLRCLPTEEKSKLLFLGRVTYTGITSQYASLFTIQDNEWVEISLEGVKLQEDSLLFITDDNRLLAVPQESGSNPTEMLTLWDEQEIYSWDEHMGQFGKDAVFN